MMRAAITGQTVIAAFFWSFCKSATDSPSLCAARKHTKNTGKILPLFVNLRALESKIDHIITRNKSDYKEPGAIISNAGECLAFRSSRLRKP